MDRRRLIERGLIGAGLVLLGLWGAARLHGWILGRSDLRRFEEARAESRTRVTGPAAPAPPVEVPPKTTALVTGPADFTRWSESRIRAYKESLPRSTDAPLAVLRIPRIGLEVAVLEGTDDLTLNRAVGHIGGTALPGEPGNVGIAGHRDGFFRGLKDVTPGDAVELALPSGDERYTVAEIRIVGPSDVSVLDPTSGKTITLVTCYPFYYVGAAPKRFILTAVSATMEGRSSR